MTYVDLFAGCGGLSLGLHNAGWKGLFAVEKSSDAFATLKFNLIDKLNHFNWPKWLGEPSPLDIKRVIKKYPNELKALRGKVDLITGGPPCQGFSTAGKRDEKDKRNELIHDYLKFIELVKPKLIFFENVKGFTMEFNRKKSKGENYSTYVENKLDEIGYNVWGDIIDFSEYGIPQKRCRFILVGIRKDFAVKNEIESKSFFEKLRDNREKFLVSKKLNIAVNLEEAISDLMKKNGTTTSPDTNGFLAGTYSNVKSSYQKYLRGNKKQGEVGDSHRFVNHTSIVEERLKHILKVGTRNQNINEELRSKFILKKRNLMPLNGKLIPPTLSTIPDDYIHYEEPRVFTVRECARIQSFPDSFEFKGKYTTGGRLRKMEVPRYTQIGNAVPPLFGEQSGLVLKQLMGK